MTGARLGGLCFLVFGSALFLLLGFSLEPASRVSMADFKVLYYGTRCLLEHRDPYNESDLERVYLAEDGDPPARKALLRDIVVLFIYLPTAFPFMVPFALLPWGLGHVCWMLLIAGSFILAACLMWEMGAANAPLLSGALLCLFLAGSELLIEVGNTAGIVVSLCVIAAWCFLRERFAPAGILCLAISLLIKPHDAGCVWLYFLLAGGLYRKRALQTLLLTAVLGIPAIIWVSVVAPHWIEETHAKVLMASEHGGVDDPGPAGVEPRNHGAISINLQTAVSVFVDDPRIYNPVTYLICAPLLLIWMYTTVQKRASLANAKLALAAIAALSMLPVYHRQHDARLILLAFPAFAMLWDEGGLRAWLALLVMALGTVFTSNIAMQLLAAYTVGLRASVNGLPGELLTVLLCRPAPLALLAMGIFLLWTYVRRTSTENHAHAEASMRNDALRMI